jgi:hypothetical protein
LREFQDVRDQVQEGESHRRRSDQPLKTAVRVADVGVLASPCFRQRV